MRESPRCRDRWRPVMGYIPKCDGSNIVVVFNYITRGYLVAATYLPIDPQSRMFVDSADGEREERWEIPVLRNPWR